MNLTTRLAERPIPTVWSGGRVVDLADPDPAIVCFLEVANTLSKIARFNGRNPHGAYSVAQHSVMGAQAVLNEGGTRVEAALFLLHDAHEWVLGDLITPAAELYGAVAAELYGETRLADAVAACKAAWDEAIFFAAGLPGPEAWTVRQKKLVRSMDSRMAMAEAFALFGASPGRHGFTHPKLTGAISPWPAMRAEERFVAMAHKLIGMERVTERVAIAAARRAV